MRPNKANRCSCFSEITSRKPAKDHCSIQTPVLTNINYRISCNIYDVCGFSFATIPGPRAGAKLLNREFGLQEMIMSGNGRYWLIALIIYALSTLIGNNFASAQSRLPPIGECPQPRFTGKAPPDYLARSNPLSATTESLATGEDRKSTRLNSSHVSESRMPSSA